MDPLKLITFLDLAETLSYTETAERLYISQATVSKHILALEKSLDVALFIRDHHSVKLTDVGKTLIPLAKRVVTANDDLLHGIDQVKENRELTLNIHTIPSIGQYPAFSLITDFMKQYPEVRLNLAEAEAETLVPSLERHTSDIVFMRIFDLAKCHYDRLVQATDHFVVVLPKTHQLANRQTVSMAELAGESFLQLDETTNLYEPAMRLIRSVDPDTEVQYKGKRIDLILDMIKGGLGVSIVMANSVHLQDHADLVAVSLTPEVKSLLAFVRPLRNHSKASQMFWDYCQQHAK